MNIEEFEEILSEINHIKSQRFVNENELQNIMIKLRSLHFSVDYRELLMEFFIC